MDVILQFKLLSSKYYFLMEHNIFIITFLDDFIMSQHFVIHNICRESHVVKISDSHPILQITIYMELRTLISSVESLTGSSQIPFYYKCFKISRLYFLCLPKSYEGKDNVLSWGFQRVEFVISTHRVCHLHTL